MRAVHRRRRHCQTIMVTAMPRTKAAKVQPTMRPTGLDAGTTSPGDSDGGEDDEGSVVDRDGVGACVGVEVMTTDLCDPEVRVLVRGIGGVSAEEGLETKAVMVWGECGASRSGRWRSGIVEAEMTLETPTRTTGTVFCMGVLDSKAKGRGEIETLRREKQRRD